jgi:hypothetical protein
MTTAPHQIVRRKIGLLEVGVVLAIVGVLALIVYGIVQSERKKRAHHDDRMKVLLIQAMLPNWNDFGGRLPPAQVRNASGEVLYSWRFALLTIILPDVGVAGFYGQIPAPDQPWTAKANERFTHPPFNEPQVGPPDFIDPTRPGCRARFAAITGPGTAFDDNQPTGLQSPHTSKSAGIVPSHTILFVEVRNCAKHYMEPGGDLDVRTMDHTVGKGTGNDPSGVYPDGFWVGFADRQAWYLSHDVPFDTLSHFFTLDSASRHNRKTELAKYRLYTAQDDSSSD